MRKGITPIIAIIILLLIVVAIAGSAYTYIMGYYSGLTAKTVELTSVTCTAGTVTMIVHNIGTDVIQSSDWIISTELIQGTGSPSSFNTPSSIDIGGSGNFNFTCGAGNVCRGRIIVSRSIAEAQINC